MNRLAKELARSRLHKSSSEAAITPTYQTSRRDNRGYACRFPEQRHQFDTCCWGTGRERGFEEGNGLLWGSCFV